MQNHKRKGSITTMTNTTTTTARILLDSMHQAANEGAIESLINNYGYSQETALKLVTEIDGTDFELDVNSAF